MPRLTPILLAAGLNALPLAALSLIALPATALAQAGPFADHGAIDAAVESFAGAPTGGQGGARTPVDRRLRLTACETPLALSWQGRRQDMVKVECTQGLGWRIFVPINAVPAPETVVAAQAPRVQRGQVLTIALVGRGFTVTQQGEALEEGAVGDWIRVRPEGNREAVRARVDNPGRVVIPLS